ncbi:GH36-type glycosyl hydrolase domain-containing protein [Chitinophagaceae bacterium LWZ2-11]
MKEYSKKGPQKDIFSDMLPQAIATLKKSILDPIFGENLMKKYANEKPPLRSELFTIEQLEQYAKYLAENHILATEKPSEQLLKRLAENEDALLEVHELLTESVKTNYRIVPAGEWLLDNFYLIEEQIYTGKKHLPKGYSRGLPQLLKGASAGLPRVYDIAVEIVSHSDGRVDLKSLTGFITAYQTVTTLKLGELWAIPIMLRLALLENLRRLATQIALDILNKNLADYWADQMTEKAENNPKDLVLVIADMARSNPPMDSSFVAELTRRLQGKGASLALPLSWIEQRLSEQGLSGAELVHMENQKQASDQVSISNSIGSLRFLSTNDWKEFVEDTSVVDKILREEASGIYPKMDFYTRDRYRHTVEKIAKNSTVTEEEIAKIAVEFAKSNADKNIPGDRTAHVGYYLIDKGVKRIEKLAEMHFSFGDSLRKIFNKIPVFFYTGAIAVISFLITWLLIAKAYREGLQDWRLIILGAICVCGTSQLALTLINWLATILARPHLLPRMDFSKGIPEEYCGMVVVPTLLPDLKELDELVEALEVRFLANRDANLQFALLTDFIDAKEEILPGEEALIQLAKNKITALNRKYDRTKNDTFFLFHRPRKWNAKDKLWMGYERKRGKLSALNGLLRGRGKENFMVIVGEEAVYRKVKYIITLDTDTLLPRDAAWKMIGTMAHPLNKAVYSKEKQRVSMGYTILQPRVSTSLPNDESSLYARIHGNEPGTDPYTRAISDVYQDLFKQGSYIGKGIYDLDVFEETLENRFPDNRILSHDLLEGCYARSALMSDVQLYEAYPSRYSADIKRRHRWVRGDWQIACWALPFVPGADKRYRKNPLTALSRWKIFDNLRRSLVPLCLTLMMLYGWFVAGNAWFWTIAVILLIMLPAVVTFVWDICHKPKDTVLWQHTMYSIRNAYNHFIIHLLDFVFLPYEAFVNVDAIVRTGWRMFITKKKLLEWNPSNNPLLSAHKNIVVNYIMMWFEPLLAVSVFVYLTIHSSLALIIEVPVLIIWMLSPIVAWVISLPKINRERQLSIQQTIVLQKLARKIWGFFEEFVGQEDNWLPPDNFQEHPSPKIAHRTSPTNIGLSLLANLSAYDFGYITCNELIERTSATINTMQRMEKFSGHLYNWYDTVTLAPLNPRYISTVDSGNLVGHLIVLKQGLIDIGHNKIFSSIVFRGFADTVRIIINIDRDPVLIQLEKELDTMQYLHRLHHVKDALDKVSDTVGAFTAKLNNDDSELYWWGTKLKEQVGYAKQELSTFAPWILLPRPIDKFQEVFDLVEVIPTLNELAKIEMRLLPQIAAHYNDSNTKEENEQLEEFRLKVVEAGRRAKERVLILESLAQECLLLANIDYDFLYDKSQNLLAIGYNAEEHRRDASYYDLLASEARLTTFTGIAQGKLPQESWFALGRQVTNVGTTPVLLSWSGSMFEYLMPNLVMPSYENTLLDQTCKAVIEKQIDYGKKRGVPWGISESAYNMVDASLNYQYRAFGVPGLGFKRGLGEDLVISPYSTVMALMIAPHDAYDNLEVLHKAGFDGRYGFYEAIDYTASRLPRGQKSVLLKSFMVHHQGMSFLSLAHVLLNQPMQKRFEAEVHFQSTLLLLQERIPRVSTFYSPSVHVSDTSMVSDNDTPMRVITTPHTPTPEVQLLSNGRYNIMVTNSGGGYSKWKDIAVTRWYEDATRDNWGTFCFIRDMDNNAVWSSAYRPALQQGDGYEAVFSQGRAEFRRKDHSIETHTEIVVSPEDDVELRRVHITNRSRKKRYIEVTSYAEVVLTSPAADSAHPAFSNLFVQTEIVAQRNAIVCTRRPRTTDEQTPAMFHLMKAYNAEIKEISYETDRSQFIGRGNAIHQPQVINGPAPLSGTAGSVLDPIVAVQYRIVIEPQETAIVDMVFGIADTRDLCNGLIEKYQDRPLTNRAFSLSWTHSQVVLRQINATESDAQLYGRLASSVIFANPALRTDASVILKNRRGQSGLWSYSISGDLPIVLLQIEDSSNIELVKQLIQAHAYWRLKGLMVDLVIWNEDHGGYRQTLQNEIMGLIAPGIAADYKDQPGGIFVRTSDQLSNEDRILFQTVARIVISDKLGTLEEQISRRSKVRTIIPYFSPSRFYPSLQTSVTLPTDLQFFNGTGGFAKNGKEYVIIIKDNQSTPAPWSNVIANPNFGTVISESGQSYTWAENAHEFRLTPWNNDPVSDLAGEVFYLRDEENGKFWSPTPLQSRGKMPYITRHGFGYSIFEHSEDGIHSEMWVFTDTDASIKFTLIKLTNQSNRPRKLSVTGYVEWVLGDLRSKSLMHTVTEPDPETGALLARNSYNTEFDNRIAFFDVDDNTRTFTTDRAEFIGRNGTLRNPESMNKARLSGKSGAGSDPCAVIQVEVDLADGEEHHVVFRLGAGKDINEALNIIKQFKGVAAAYKALDSVHKYWNKTINTIQINTPDDALNTLTNGWLNYQSLASRIWGRSGFYQSGGAFGFRDQLQDVLSLMHSDPQIARDQILLNASRQFKEGDVQHWWHPPVGRGVRTTCSDDYLWLAFVTCRYVTHTGDIGILDEDVSFIEGRLLNPGEESNYDLPTRSRQTANLYTHCLKAIEHGLRLGEHGLPLMGTGDWNDGMDNVGREGKGESVWLAFFLYDILIKFKQIAADRNDTTFAERCATQAANLQNNIEQHAWDGAWYKRAYFDDGTPLGSSVNEECKIDAIAQSWSVLSKAGEAKHARTAMASVNKELVMRDAALIQLFKPAFDKSSLNPGYIKGYVPGVRENGGQYTHAAIWTVMAFAALKEKQLTWELLQLINPLNHADTADKVARYKVEPYVIAADVYAESLHVGRGGWTWYTGSAGWMYQLIIEWVIGLKRKGNTLYFEPCIPAQWENLTIQYRYMETVYNITMIQGVINSNNVKVFINGQEQADKIVILVDDKETHEIKVTLGDMVPGMQTRQIAAEEKL